MPGKSGFAATLAEGGIRSVSSKVFEFAETQEMTQKAILWLRSFLDTAPGGSYLKDYLRAYFNTHLKGKKLAAIEPFLEKLFQNEEPGQETTQASAEPPVKVDFVKVFNAMAAIKDEKAREALHLQVAGLEDVSIYNALKRIGDLDENGLAGLAQRLAHQGEKADILNDAVFVDLRISGVTISSPESERAMMVLLWLLLEGHSDAFNNIVKLKVSDAYDSKIDSVNYSRELAKFFPIGQRHAAMLLAQVCAKKSPDEIAQMFSVRKSSVTQIKTLVRDGWRYINRPVGPEVRRRRREGLNAHRVARGFPALPEIPIIGGGETTSGANAKTT